MTMTKSEIIDLLFEKTGLTKKECASAMESTIDIIKSELENGNDVKISGFGKWNIRSKKERNGRNLKTGEAVKISARKVVSFKPSAVLRGTVNTA